MNTKGSSGTFESLSGGLESYTVWCLSPNSFTNPDQATGVNVRITGDIRDTSQKAFEILVQSISLRASPVILQEPVAVEELSMNGSTELNGEGFTWCFSTERRDQFIIDTDPTGLLRLELDGIVLPNGTVITTDGLSQNIEFARKETLC